MVRKLDFAVQVDINSCTEHLLSIFCNPGSYIGYFRYRTKDRLFSKSSQKIKWRETCKPKINVA